MDEGVKEQDRIRLSNNRTKEIYNIYFFYGKTNLIFTKN